MVVVGSSTKDKVIDFFIYFGITIFSLLVLYPFYYVVINSLNADLQFGPAFLFPKTWTAQNYISIFRDNTILSALLISVLRTVTGIVFVVFFNAMCSFALRKTHIAFRGVYIVLLTIPVFFSGGLIPNYLNLRMLGLLNTFFVYIFPESYNFFFLIILMSCFRDISDDLEASAKIDGAGYFTIFIRIYLPLSIPVLATMALFEGVRQWNSWFDTLYFTNSNWLMTLSGHLIQVIKKSSAVSMQDVMKDMEKMELNPQGVRLATMVAAVTPIIFIYPFLQRYFVKGLRIGSIKG